MELMRSETEMQDKEKGEDEAWRRMCAGRKRREMMKRGETCPMNQKEQLEEETGTCAREKR